MLKVIATPNAPAAFGPFSQAIVYNGLLFTSGLMPLDPATGNVVGSDITAQAEQLMKNISAVLEAAGTDFSKVIKATCYLTDMADFAAFNEVYGKYLISKPARSCVAVRALAKGAICEVELIAAVD